MVNGRPGCEGASGHPFIEADIRSDALRLAMRAEALCCTKDNSCICLVTLRNVGSSPAEVPNDDVDGHLGIFINLIDSDGKDARLTPLGEKQFRNFQGLFVGTRTIDAGKCLSWQVDCSKSFFLAKGKQYSVHVSYSICNPSKWPDIELTGLNICGG
jgi:hypothetical protein